VVVAAGFVVPVSVVAGFAPPGAGELPWTAGTFADAGWADPGVAPCAAAGCAWGVVAAAAAGGGGAAGGGVAARGPPPRGRGGPPPRSVAAARTPVAPPPRAAWPPPDSTGPA